jgi:hypothetical protein
MYKDPRSQVIADFSRLRASLRTAPRLNVIVASHLSNLPAIATEAFTFNPIELFALSNAKTGTPAGAWAHAAVIVVKTNRIVRPTDQMTFSWFSPQKDPLRFQKSCAVHVLRFAHDLIFKCNSSLVDRSRFHSESRRASSRGLNVGLLFHGTATRIHARSECPLECVHAFLVLKQQLFFGLFLSCGRLSRCLFLGLGIGSSLGHAATHVAGNRTCANSDTCVTGNSPYLRTSSRASRRPTKTSTLHLRSIVRSLLLLAFFSSSLRPFGGGACASMPVRCLAAP